MNLRAVNDDAVEEPKAPTRHGNLSVWWFVVVSVLLVVVLTRSEYDRRDVRRELDDNAALIKQLQERRVVDELIGIKRKGT